MEHRRFAPLSTGRLSNARPSAARAQQPVTQSQRLTVLIYDAKSRLLLQEFKSKTVFREVRPCISGSGHAKSSEGADLLTEPGIDGHAIFERIFWRV
jgi:hypothetical protein